MRNVFYGLSLLAALGLLFYLLLPANIFATTVGHIYEGVFVSKKYPETTVSFVGDVFLGRDVEVKMSRWGLDFPFLGDQVNGREIRIGNFEAAVPQQHLPTPVGGFQFSVPESHLAFLAEAGFLYLSLANNHSLDHGFAGLEHTVTSLQNSAVTPFGQTAASSTAKIALDNKMILGITGFNDVTQKVTPELVHQQALVAAEDTSYQIAYVHWGEEYELIHGERQEKLAQLFIDAGYDVVIGHHPHVVQDVGWYKGVPIFYSLGNYIFDQYFSADVQHGLRLNLRFTTAGAEYELIPVTSKETYIQPQPLVGDEKQIFLDNLSERSVAPIKNGKIKQQI